MKIHFSMKTYPKWLESWKEGRLDITFQLKKKIMKKYWVLSEINLILWEATSFIVRVSFWFFYLSSGISTPKNAPIFMKLKLNLGETYLLTSMALNLEKKVLVWPINLILSKISPWRCQIDWVIYDFLMNTFSGLLNE